MTYHYFHKWMSDHVNNDLFGLGDVFCRRGISIAKLPEDHSLYLENSFINSYSLALSVPEQFTEIDKSLSSVFINQRYSILENRILFFSPFIPKMDAFQIELGIIPHWNNLKWFSNGVHGGINEYQIDTEVDYTEPK